MNRNTRILKMGNNTIAFYDYYITNACVVKFIDTDLQTIKAFFGNGIHTGLQEVNSDGKVLAEETFYLQKKNIFIENTIVIEKEIRIIKEAYDEIVRDDFTGESTVIHHEAVTETINHEIPVEMTTVMLEKPEVEDEIGHIKKDVSNLKNTINASTYNNDQAMTLFGFMTLNLTDEQALSVSYFVPRWVVGMDIKEGDRVSIENENGEIELYKCNKDKGHIAQELWKPSQTTASIWTRIEPEHAGTKEDPIPYHVNMEVFENKYYTEDGVLYMCTRNSGQALQNKANELVGHYFAIVEN